MYMLWFNFIPGLNFISHCFNLIIIHNHTPKQREVQFKPGIKLNLTTYIHVLLLDDCSTNDDFLENILFFEVKIC